MHIRIAYCTTSPRSQSESVVCVPSAFCISNPLESASILLGAYARLGTVLFFTASCIQYEPLRGKVNLSASSICSSALRPSLTRSSQAANHIQQAPSRTGCEIKSIEVFSDALNLQPPLPELGRSGTASLEAEMHETQPFRISGRLTRCLV